MERRKMKKWAKQATTKKHSARTTTKKKCSWQKIIEERRQKKMCIDRQFITNTLFFSWHYAKRLLFPSCVLALFSINDTLYGGCLDVVWNAQHSVLGLERSNRVEKHVIFALILHIISSHFFSYLEIFFCFFLVWCTFRWVHFFSSPFACISSDCESNKCAFRHYECCFSFT